MRHANQYIYTIKKCNKNRYLGIINFQSVLQINYNIDFYNCQKNDYKLVFVIVLKVDGGKLNSY